MVKTTTPHMIIIGRAEPLFLVGLCDDSVPAKVDSGAYRSSMHAKDIVVSDGLLSCTLLAGHPVCQGLGIPFTTKDFKQVTVTNSFGVTEDRYEIQLKIKLAHKIITTGFTLADRSKNIYPILLGRTFLNKRFIIDTSKTGISRLELKQLRENAPNEVSEEL